MSVDIEVHMSGKRPSPFGIRSAMVRWANDTLPTFNEDLRRFAPTAAQSMVHMLRDTIHGVRDTSSDSVKITYTSAAPYTKYVLKGTRPHEIWPDRAHALRWLGDRGEFVFATHVYHPGTRANPFPRRAWQASRGVILSKLREEVRREL